MPMHVYAMHIPCLYHAYTMPIPLIYHAYTMRHGQAARRGELAQLLPSPTAAGTVSPNRNRNPKP